MPIFHITHFANRGALNSANPQRLFRALANLGGHSDQNLSASTRFCEANPARAANAALAKKERQLISRHTAQVFSGEGAALGHSEARSTLDSLKLVDSPHPLYSHEDLFI